MQRDVGGLHVARKARTVRLDRFEGVHLFEGCARL